MAAAPWEEYQTDQTSEGPWAEYQQPAQPVSAPQGMTPDQLTQDINQQDWLTRQGIGLGGTLTKAYQGVAGALGADFTPEERMLAETAAREGGGWGSFIGEVAKYAPVAAASVTSAPIAVGAGIAAGLGTMYQPGDIGERLGAGATEAAWTAGGGQAAKQLGKLGSTISKMGSLDRARRVLGDIIGPDDIDRARQLADDAAASGVPMTTAQALERLKNPVLSKLDESIRGTSATGRESVESAKYYAALAAKQEADRLAQLEQLARAGSTEASEALRNEARRRLEKGLGPLREAELGAANTAGQVTQRIAPRLASAEQGAEQMVQGVRDFTAASQRAAERAASTYPVAGMPRVPGRYTYADELAQRAEELAGKSASGSLVQGENARFLQRQLDSLEAYGLRTLQPDAILGRIDTMLKSPKTGVSDVNQKVLGKVADKVREWSQGGTIDAKALYEIRKTTINETVDDLLRGNPKASKQYAASLTAQIRPLIDDAIENAGGTDWKRYITSYRKGLEGIDRLELLDNARQLYKTNPKAFMEMVKGESPETVRAIMSGKTGVEDALGSSTLKKLENVAGQLERDASLKNLAGTKGADRALKQILEDESFVAKLPNMLNRYAVLANTAAKAGELKINARMYSHLEKAMRDPKAFKSLIDTLPLAERNQMVKFVFDTAAQGGKAVPVAAAATGSMQQ